MGAGIIGGGLTKTLGIPKKDIRNVLIIVGLTNILAIKGGLYTYFAQSRVVLKISFLPFNLMKKKNHLSGKFIHSWWVFIVIIKCFFK